MNQNDIDTFIDTIRLFGYDKRFIVRFNEHSINITIRNDKTGLLIGETWSNGTNIEFRAFNGFNVNLS